MEIQNKATALWGNFFKLEMPQIRTFHMSLMLFGLFVQMSNGATFSVVPFVNNSCAG
jgi:hypothetical protein